MRCIAAGMALPALALLWGCAMIPNPQPATSARPPAASAPQGGTTRAVTPARVDSGPSPEAAQVLNTIPEPLAASERVPPPTAVVSVDGDSARTTGESPQADTSYADVPVPEATTPLGERAGGGTSSDSTAAPSQGAPAAPAAPPPAPSPGSGPSTAASDSCWRVQIVAPADKTRAEAFRSAASSQLFVPFVIETEQKLHKVRSRDCMTRAMAEATRARALQSGFKGAFLFLGKKP